MNRSKSEEGKTTKYVNKSDKIKVVAPIYLGLNRNTQPTPIRHTITIKNTIAFIFLCRTMIKQPHRWPNAHVEAPNELLVSSNQRIEMPIDSSKTLSSQMKPVRPLELYKMVKRPGGRLLGMDVGNKYVGLAISTEQYNFASLYG